MKYYSAKEARELNILHMSRYSADGMAMSDKEKK